MSNNLPEKKKRHQNTLIGSTKCHRLNTECSTEKVIAVTEVLLNDTIIITTAFLFKI